ncbi:YoaK family protein [Aequorivita todarodis]|uniref:YoaK family protein n=1 Tax=Aequorivita todarodis TaxID=2036821 RepID=UPI002350AECC|nr:YoaK family protein [Aequorivita todarodis]MDC8002234.1 YoaK family protein [Aequorivita todarodis]
MFKHQGKSRTMAHNLHIAVVLSFVAGMVNVAGFLAFRQLTTNVTGHFTFFVADLAEGSLWLGFVYFLYIFSFLAGSMAASLLIEQFKTTRKLNVFVVPTFIEILLLSTVGLVNFSWAMDHANLLICLLLFTMGLQNSFVTRISNAVVRTTHLTGLFTDLGIDLSYLFFPKRHRDRKTLNANIKLRIYIICSFLGGGLVAGFLYIEWNLQLKTLLIGAFILLLSLFLDDLRFGWYQIQRKHLR